MNHNIGNNWQRPFTLIENLESSVKSLSTTNGTLNSTLNSLRSVTKEFTRQCELTKFTRKYELVTERDIERTQTDISKEIQPEIDDLFSEVDLLLTALKSEEKDLNLKLDEQNKYLEDLESTLTKLQTNIQHNNLNRNNVKRKRLVDAKTRHELESKRTRIQELTSLKRTQENESLEMTKQVEALKIQLLDMEKQMEVDTTNSNHQRSDNNTELEQELEKLRELFHNKQKEFEKRLEQQKEHAKSRETTVADSTQVTTSEYIAQYTNVMELIDKILPQLESPAFVASAAAASNCITQSKRYSLAIKKEESEYPPLNASSTEKNEQLKRLFRAIYPYGKAVGSLMDLLLANPKKQVTLQELFEKFPPEKEKRHNIQQAVYILLQANILDLSDTGISLKQ